MLNEISQTKISILCFFICGIQGGKRPPESSRGITREGEVKGESKRGYLQSTIYTCMER